MKNKKLLKKYSEVKLLILCKAERLRYRNSNMDDLREKLRIARENGGAPYPHRHRRRLLHGRLLRAASRKFATLPKPLAQWSWWMIRTPWASWAHTAQAPPVRADRVDILTGTLGKALGGAAGGYVASQRELVELLKQRARPYLFSNAVARRLSLGRLRH